MSLIQTTRCKLQLTHKVVANADMLNTMLEDQRNIQLNLSSFRHNTPQTSRKSTDPQHEGNSTTTSLVVLNPNFKIRLNIACRDTENLLQNHRWNARYMNATLCLGGLNRISQIPWEFRS
jgi:hypothetical protein